jgi:hypothetical protein
MKLCPTCKLRYPTEATHCFVDRTALILAPDPYLGSVIAGRYRIEEVIGAAACRPSTGPWATRATGPWR